jgi:hypothetical protein
MKALDACLEPPPLVFGGPYSNLASTRRARYGDALVTGLWPSLDVLPEPEKAEAGRRIRESTLQVACVHDTLLSAPGSR